jgi:hypothetical protein
MTFSNISGRLRVKSQKKSMEVVEKLEIDLDMLCKK